MTDQLNLAALIAASVARYKAMTQEERRAHDLAQKESFVRAEVGFGSDADEAAYRDAYRSGDTETLRRLQAEETARLAQFDKRNKP